jgi:hypothetical protein
VSHVSRKVSLRPALLRRAKVSSPLFLVALAAELLVASPAWAEGVPVADATAAQRKQAAHELAKGQKLFKAAKFPEAIVALSKSHDIVADPEARLLIARAQQNGGGLVAALAEYEGTVREARPLARDDDKYRKLLETAQRERQELEGVVAKVMIRLRYAPPGTKVDIDGEVVPTEKLSEPIVLSPGLVRFTARTPDGLETDRQLTLTAGQDAKVELAFPRDTIEPSAAELKAEQEPGPDKSAESDAPSATPGNGKRTAAFVAAGVGVAGLAAFGVFGAISNSKYHQLQDACVDNRCPTSSRNDIDQGKRFQTIANVGLAVGIVGVATSAALFVWAWQAPGKPESDAAVSQLKLSVGPAAVQLAGCFQ